MCELLDIDNKQIEKLLLMGAAVHEMGPSTKLSQANTNRVIEQTLRWMGMSEETYSSELEETGTTFHRVHLVLVQMTHRVHPASGPIPDRPGPILFEGGGNWGIPRDPDSPPSWPNYTSCRLTEYGEQVAKELLMQHPEYTRTDWFTEN